MATEPQEALGSVPARAERARAGRITGGGTAGNERLTALTGAVLLVLLAVIGVTILRIGQLLWLHLFIGMLLIGPVALKMATTGYRFVRYYTANPRYRRKGPPPMLLRAMGPVLVLSTVAVLATGVALLFVGPSSRDELLPIHKITFFVWLAFMGLHVLLHLPRIPIALRGDYGRRAGLSSAAGARSTNVTGRDGRALALAGALVGGLVLALLVVPEFAPWMHTHFHHHGG